MPWKVFLLNPYPLTIITHCEELLSCYDVLLCDVWGVLHDGVTAYPGAVRTLKAFRKKGGCVVLISNAPVPEGRVAEMLKNKRVERDTWDGIISSGRIALDLVKEKNFCRVYPIGPQERDKAFFSHLPADLVGIEEAEAIVCTGLNKDQTETVDDYREILLTALRRRLPFVCANPDLVVDVQGTLFLCAGALAEAYLELGGEVLWAGKPFPEAYDRARSKAEEYLGRKVSSKRILAIGDGIRTDVIGAHQQGLDLLFVSSGIHRAEIMSACGTKISQDSLQKALERYSSTVIAVTTGLRW